MDYQAFSAVAAFAFLYSLVASRLERTIINGALVYVLVGFLCGPDGFGLVDIQLEGEGLKNLAELTLALVLFTDSANTNLTTLHRIESIPLRLLLIGLPLTIALGFVVGYFLFGGLLLFEVAVLATMLAPTDAALGKAVVTNQAVPESVRESLNLESGLNDGICVPVLLFFLALTAGETGIEEAAGLVVTLPVRAIGIGVLIGVVAGVGGSQLLKFCHHRRWIAGRWLQVPVIALALVCFGVTEHLHGSGFIACFVGGLVFGALSAGCKQDYMDATETTGDVMALVTWFVAGAAAIGLSWEFVDWKVLLYAILSLTVVRMLPVYLCLFGLKLDTETKLFIGWFGPRGLASIVFMVIVFDEQLPGADVLLATVTTTILLSVILHGVTANPWARRLGSRTGLR
jgi:NhaP-type Na+/H+ or K+/H+ antiporter